MKTRSLSLLFLTLFSATLLSGCFLFRKKNKCNSCPHFSKAPAEASSARS